jgi:hypothetical protein
MLRYGRTGTTVHGMIGVDCLNFLDVSFLFDSQLTTQKHELLANEFMHGNG